MIRTQAFSVEKKKSKCHTPLLLSPQRLLAKSSVALTFHFNSHSAAMHAVKGKATTRYESSYTCTTY